jgi:hypothetical protein
VQEEEEEDPLAKVSLTKTIDRRCVFESLKERGCVSERSKQLDTIFDFYSCSLDAE